MNAVTAERSEFDPPPPRGFGRAFAVALLAHLLLILALTWGLRWKNDADDAAIDAELWAAASRHRARR